MKSQRELIAVTVTAIIGILLLIVLFYVQPIPASPIRGALEQNSGRNALHESLPADSGLRDGEE